MKSASCSSSHLSHTTRTTARHIQAEEDLGLVSSGMSKDEGGGGRGKSKFPFAERGEDELSSRGRARVGNEEKKLSGKES